MGFPDSSAGKECTCNAGDPGSIPGLGRSAGKGTGYPLQYSWASPLAQMVNNPPAMRETWVRSLGWEDLLEKGMGTHFSILTWRIPMDRGVWEATIHSVPKSRTWLKQLSMHAGTWEGRLIFWGYANTEKMVFIFPVFSFIWKIWEIQRNFL